MSRKVDVNDPDSWDEDDIQYLGDRNMLPPDYQREYDQEVREPEEMPLEERANTGDANTEGVSKEEYERRAAALAEEVEEEALEPPYGQHNKDLLIAELVRRAEVEGYEPNVDGRKEELVARLEELDEQSAGQEEGE